LRKTATAAIQTSDGSRGSLPITTAKITREEVVNNRTAALPANLPYLPLGWNAITMCADPKLRTTATLYGNDEAVLALHPREAVPGSPKYPAGALLALITWVQRDAPRFGARIPNLPALRARVRLPLSPSTALGEGRGQ
jgi:hypothetical protein